MPSTVVATGTPSALKCPKCGKTVRPIHTKFKPAGAETVPLAVCPCGRVLYKKALGPIHVIEKAAIVEGGP